MSNNDPTSLTPGYLLLPKMNACPKCGCEDVHSLSMTPQFFIPEGAQYFCVCLRCAAASEPIYDNNTPNGDEELRAIERWNTEDPPGRRLWPAAMLSRVLVRAPSGELAFIPDEADDDLR